jgi:hypothetical protein
MLVYDMKNDSFSSIDFQGTGRKSVLVADGLESHFRGFRG